MEEDVKTIGDYIGIIKRRKWALLIPIIFVFIVAVIAAITLPRTYRSSSTILIEEQEIPRDFVISTVTGFADQRLQMINQRIMSTSRLLEIINRFNLYADLRSKMTMEEVVAIMRKDIRFETISADILDTRSATPSKATIAFTVAYDGKNPQMVQQVASILASLYLEENLKTREQRTAGASRFLEEEAKTIQGELADYDSRIAAFKAKNVDALPELQQVNYQGLDRIEGDLNQLQDQLKTLQEKEGYLQTQLASVPTESSDQDRNLLKDLRAKLVQLQNRYSDKYPDVSKTKQDIAELEKRIALSPPDEKGPPKKSLTSVADQANNASYVTLASQLSGVQSDIESVKRQISETQRRRQEYIRRTEAGPRVEETYKTLMVQRNNAQSKYDELMKRVMEARVAQGLEKEQMGERFTLIDPARLPEKPVKPNVPAILLIGLFLGIGSGVGTLSLREYNDQSARHPDQLSDGTNHFVLGSIPLIVTEDDRRQVRNRRRRVGVAIGIGVVVAILLFHFLVMDLEVLWAKVSQRLMM
jgi:polysaccharide chain length determinant protein (PEP-CTERM system associated)